jgi:hypothetical protein
MHDGEHSYVSHPTRSFNNRSSDEIPCSSRAQIYRLFRQHPLSNEQRQYRFRTFPGLRHQEGLPVMKKYVGDKHGALQGGVSELARLFTSRGLST